MNFISRRDSARSAKKILFVIFVCYVVANHAIYAMASGASGGGGYGAGDAGGRIISSLNDFRLATGDLLRSGSSICPLSIDKYCAGFLDVLTTLLGLGR